MNVETLETRIYEFEEVRVCIRAPWNEEVGAYTLERKAAGNMSLNAWLDSRVRPLLNGLHVYAIAVMAASRTAELGWRLYEIVTLVKFFDQSELGLRGRQSFRVTLSRSFERAIRDARESRHSSHRCRR